MCFARPLVFGSPMGMRRVVIGGAASLLELPGFASQAAVPRLSPQRGWSQRGR
jgi:hypothetical protein